MLLCEKFYFQRVLSLGEFFNNQIEYATTVVLSRSQKATPEQLELCVKQIQALNPKAAVITTPQVQFSSCSSWSWS